LKSRRYKILTAGIHSRILKIKISEQRRYRAKQPFMNEHELTVLATAAIAGSRNAFQQLMSHYQEMIYRMVYYRTRAKLDAEDITQDVFLKAFNNIGALKSPKRFKGWLYQIAVNRIRDYYRKKRFRSFFSLMSVDDDAFEQQPEAAGKETSEDHLIRKNFWEQVDRVLSNLSRMESEVFLLRYFDQLDLKEIAQVLGKGESTIKTHLYRAIKKLKRVSGEYDFLFLRECNE
jgi:RNA polymerase sigma-70 factor (ECF subfamily)